MGGRLGNRTGEMAEHVFPGRTARHYEDDKMPPYKMAVVIDRKNYIRSYSHSWRCPRNL